MTVKQKSCHGNGSDSPHMRCGTDHSIVFARWRQPHRTRSSVTHVSRHAKRERKCADTIGTVLVPWASNAEI